MTQPDETPAHLMERVRKLLAKAEDDSIPTAEAEALTERAATLMAKYGIDAALLAATKPETDKPSDLKLDVPNPWADVKSVLMAGLCMSMRCQVVKLNRRNGEGTRLHLFGYTSDIERVNVLYTSVLLQMAQALQRIGAPMPGMRDPMLTGTRLRTWNRSFLLGYVNEVIKRVKAAEEHAAKQVKDQQTGSGQTGALVLASREAVIGAALKDAYPKLRSSRVTYSGKGYGQGAAAGRRANIGGTHVGGSSRKALT